MQNFDRFKFRVWDHRYGKLIEVKSLHDDKVDYVGGGYGYCTNGDVELMLSTGLYDKNQKLIYQDDIILAKNGTKYLVEWGEVEAGFYLLGDTLNTNYFNDDSQDYEIIGNKFEDSKLYRNYFES